MRLRRAVIPMTILLAVLCAGHADAVSDVAVARMGAALDEARRIDEPTRHFVGLFLRVAGGVWIAVEWIAAIYLIRGFAMLRRWFAEAPR